MFWKLLLAQFVLVALVVGGVGISLSTSGAFKSPNLAVGQTSADRVIRRSSLIGMAVGGTAAVLSSWLLSVRWSRRISDVQEGVASLATGEAAGRIPGLDARDELGDLARAVDHASRELSEQVRGIDRVRRDLQSMLESIPEAVIAIDDAQRVLFANPSTYRLFELVEEDITGKKLWEVLRQPGLQDCVTLTFANREPTNSEFEVRHPPRAVSFRGRSLAVGSGLGIIMVLHDVTELRRLERMRQDFFASVSHELKTPLAAIKAYSETLLDDRLHDESVVRRFLSRIEEQADRLHALVLDMLMLARVESEDHGFDMQPVDVGAAVQSSLESFRQEVEAKRLALIASVDAAAGTVFADAEGLGMIVRNLVDNAIKYTPDGGRVTVSVVREGENAVVRVEDTGVGIPPDDLSRIFERFYRVDKARSRELGGTGLGLSIVKHLVQQFGGHISVRSRLNEGSAFTVVLPSCGPGIELAHRRVRIEEESRV